MTGREETNRILREKISKKVEGNPLLQNFFVDMDSAGLEMKTCDVYINLVMHFLREVKLPPNQIQVQDVNRYIQSLKRGDKPQTYLRTLWYCLNRFFNYLVRIGSVQENIMIRVIKPKAKPSREVKRTYLTPAEYKLLLNAVDDEEDEWVWTRDRAVLRLLIETGIRCSALTEINLDDIDAIHHIIRITDKENKTTEYPVSYDLLVVVVDWIKQRGVVGGESALFLGRKGGKRISTDTVRDIITKYSYAVPGKHITPHKLRASFATNLYNQTGDIRLVQEAMNHAKIATTELYIQSDGRNRKKASSIMNSLLKGDD